jgi:hypothetical protein
MPTSTRQAWTTWAEDHDIELVFFDPPETFDQAIVGVIVGFNQEPAVLYDRERVIAALQREGLDEESAEEYFEFNTAGAYVGEATPRFLLRRG